MQLVAPRAVTMAVAIDAISCAMNHIAMYEDDIEQWRKL